MSERCERPSLFGFPFLFCIIQKSFPKLKVSRNPFVSLGPFDSAGSRWSVWVASSMNGSFPRRPGRSWDPAEIPLAPWWKRVVQRVPNGENRGSLDISVVSLVMSQGRNWRLPVPTQPQMLWVFWLQLKELEAISPTRVGIEPRNGYITHSSWRRLMTHDSWPKKSNGLWQEEPRTLVFLVTTLGKVHRRWYPCSPVEVYWSPVGKRRLSVFLDHVGATWPFEIGECQLESVEKNLGETTFYEIGRFWWMMHLNICQAWGLIRKSIKKFGDGEPNVWETLNWYEAPWYNKPVEEHETCHLDLPKMLSLKSTSKSASFVFHSFPGRTSSPGAKQRERQTEAEQKIRSWFFYMLSKAE